MFAAVELSVASRILVCVGTGVILYLLLRRKHEPGKLQDRDIPGWVPDWVTPGMWNTALVLGAQALFYAWIAVVLLMIML